MVLTHEGTNAALVSHVFGVTQSQVLLEEEAVVDSGEANGALNTHFVIEFLL